MRTHLHLAGFALALGLAAPVCAQPQAPGIDGAAESLADGVELFRRARGEQYTVAVDPNERGAIRVGRFFFTHDDVALTFQRGDEAFEREFSRVEGLGAGPPPADLPAPVPTRPVHDGERGGLDGGSCRACHFVGGFDGSGSPTQHALFRGDGTRLSSAALREAPHIMGLGYIAAAARALEIELSTQLQGISEFGRRSETPIRLPLVAFGQYYGDVMAFPDGNVDLSEVRGVSPDLVVRPFGWKGRHAELVPVADEALQVHLGMQTTARLEDFAFDPPTYLGDGGPFDADGDGVQAEASEAMAVLLGAYMSMLGIPRIVPPTDPALALIWAEGRGVFDTVGCAECHRPSLPVRDTVTRLVSGGSDPFEYVFDLIDAGQEPRPRRHDNGENAQGELPFGIPIFAYTDLRRHDLGPELAERDEAPPDGSAVVPASVWLTRPLWGLADTAPYLHDGRAPTVHEAILAHGGEAEGARDAYVNLSAHRKGALRVFLMSLSRDTPVVVE